MNQEIENQLNQAEIILSNIDENAGIEYATWTKDKAKIKFQKECLILLLLIIISIGVI